jgi:Tol biopolymer transport system component
VWTFRTGQTQIAFAGLDGAGIEQLFTVAPGAAAGADRQQLTAATVGVWDFGVAPDGSRVVFSALKENGGADLWSATPGGGPPELLVECIDVACSTPSISPDGRLLVFNKGGYATAMVSPPRLWLLDLESGEQAPVFDDSQRLGFDARWSGDGEWLTYISPERVGVGLFNLEDGSEQFFATSAGETGAWNPVRLELVYALVTEVQGQPVTHLLANDLESGAQRNLSGEGALVEDNSPAFSPDGEWIAFRRKEYGGERASPGKQIWLMRADGSDARPLTLAPGYDHGSPQWSPDGNSLTYQRFALKGPNIEVEVIVQDVASGAMQVAARPGQRPLWIP